jgi:D-alanine-D-alanine ligase
MKFCIIFGGPSVEHDVSILTALHAMRHMKNPHLVYLTPQGQMVTSCAGGVLGNIDNYAQKPPKGARKCFFANGALYKFGRLGVRRVTRVDAVLNCCHGGPGEDGRLAAMFDVIGIPITSCPPVAALNLQSKTRTREILTAAGFAQPKFQRETGKEVCRSLPFPLIVKPDTLGSSIGITIAHNEAELDAALDLAFSLDTAAVVEQFLPDSVEINIAVFSHNGKIITSGIEIIKHDGEVFDFDKKYLGSAGGFITQSRGKKARRAPEPACEYEKEIRDLAIRAYEIFGCRGVVRADFLVSGGVVYLNEINTVPGFLAYHLFIKNGLPYETFIQMLLYEAQNTPKTPKNTNFSSEILQKNRNLVASSSIIL